MVSISEIQTWCEKTANDMGLEFNIPISINGRLKRTMAQVCYIKIDGSVFPTRMEFSKILLEHTSDETIWDTVKHEFAHWYLGETTHKNHNHDKEFQVVCEKLQCNSEAASTIKFNGNVYKYDVMCPNCKVIGHYYRRGKVINAIDNKTVKCAKCGSDDLFYIENY